MVIYAVLLARWE